MKVLLNRATVMCTVIIRRLNLVLCNHLTKKCLATREKAYRNIVKFGLAALLGTCFAVKANAETISGTYSIAADTCIDYKSADTNFSSSAGFSLYLNYNLKPSRMLMDVPEITVPTGMKIESVTLHLYSYDGKRSDGYSLQAHVLNTSYDLSRVTWNSSGGASYSDAYVSSNTIPSNHVAWLTFDLSPIWGDAAETNGIVVTWNELILPSTWQRADVASIESGTSVAPYLTVTFVSVPEPATFGMLGSGLAAGFLFYRLRRKR